MVSRRCRCRATPARTLDLSGPCAHHRYLLVSHGDARAVATGALSRGAIRAGGFAMKAANPFPTLLEAFFIDRLVRQRQVSPHTLASYRDTFRLLLQYAQRQLGKAPSALTLPDLDTPFLGAFLDHLEQERDNSARSRNVRLAAIHSFFRYVALHTPEHSALAQRVLAMPSKRYPRRPIDFLAPAEVAALLAAPNLDTWSGRRDRALLLLAVQTGLRASELLGLRCQDIVLGPSAHVQCQGKGRKVRSTPLRKETATVLRNWFQEHHGQPSTPAFPTTSGGALSHDGLQYLLNKHLAVACRQCASLSGKHVTPTCCGTRWRWNCFTIASTVP